MEEEPVAPISKGDGPVELIPICVPKGVVMVRRINRLSILILNIYFFFSI